MRATVRPRKRSQACDAHHSHVAETPAPAARDGVRRLSRGAPARAVGHAARSIHLLLAALMLSTHSAVVADVRVQDVAALQGQRTNKLQGIGLVVGLNNTGDGGRYPNAMRALMSLHRKYEQPVLDMNELRSNSSVALVMVEATIPEFGAREGQVLDVTVSTLGPAKSLAGGQLLTTPLQDATLSVPDILALAGGRIEIADAKAPTRGFIRHGATLEQDFFYSFIHEGAITLVLHDSQAGFPMARMVARAINHEVANPADSNLTNVDLDDLRLDDVQLATAIGPKNVRVAIPPYELADPSDFISRVLQATLFVMPEQQARVVINRTTKSVSFTGAVVISPTVLQIPGLGSVSIGGSGAAAAGAVGLDTQNVGGVPFEELLATLDKMKVSGKQLIDAIEQLDRTGTLHAKVVYAE